VVTSSPPSDPTRFPAASAGTARAPPLSALASAHSLLTRGGGRRGRAVHPRGAGKWRLRPVRVDLDCIVPYLTLAKSTRLPILLCKIANLAGAPERTVR
jgi:hypothetical protein